MNDDFIFHRCKQMTALDALPIQIENLAGDEALKEPNPIYLVHTSKEKIKCDAHAGHYFMGGLPALMQAVRLLQDDLAATVTYVCDDQIKKSTQSAHQGHVHPTEWTTPELSTWELTKILLRSFKILPKIAPDDIANYTYIHFPVSKMKPLLLIRNAIFRIVHTLSSTNGVSRDDRWQCDAVRTSLAFHKALSDEIEKTGEEPTFALSWRLIWSQDYEGIKRKKKLWDELGIHTEYLKQEELSEHTLLKDGVYGLKVIGDGKFFPNIDQKITSHLSKKHENRFQFRTATVSEVYIDEITKKPFAVRENDRIVSVDSFLGSTGHNQVFIKGSKKPLWNEVPVAGISTLWLCSIEKTELINRFGLTEDDALIERLKQLPGSANLTNLHMTVWQVHIVGNMVHIVARSTQGANFNSTVADPDDLYNMSANIGRYFIGSWKLITAGSCTRKTTTANVAELTDNFLHGLSGIGFSFSGVPKEMLFHKPLSSI
jgi:hypothetical protein